MPLDFAAFDDILNHIAADIVAGLGDGAQAIGDLAQQLAPEDQGDLKASKQVAPDGDGWLVSFGDGLPDIRAVVQEFGSINQAPNAYLTPAAASIDVTAEVAKRLAARLG